MNSALALTIMVALFPPFFCKMCLYRSCEEEPCPEVNEANCDGRIAKNASGCLGCCDVCIKILAPGARCSDEYPWTFYSETECPDGHYCDHGITNICLRKSLGSLK